MRLWREGFGAMTRPASTRRGLGSTGHAAAYGGLLVFTLLLYLRPNDLLPIGTFPIVKLVAIGALAAFFVGQFASGAPLSIMPRPFKYLLVLAGLAVVSIPVGLDSSASLDSLLDLFLKTLLVFLLMINVVTSFARLRLIMEVTVLAATGVAVLSILDYMQGKNLVEGFRATGGVGGIFGNPNDLALAMNVLLPIAVGLALIRPNPFHKGVYLACAALLAITTAVTFSRAGLLTLCVAAAFFVVKIGRVYPAAWGAGAIALAGLFAVSPGTLWNRVFTIFEATGGNASAAASATARWRLVTRSVEVAGANPIRWLFGIGMQNFHIVSHDELGNHNSYLQVFNELGLPAMVVYMLFLASVVRSAGRSAERCRKARGLRQAWLAAVAIQTSLVAYAVGSVFASVAYLWYLYYPAAFAVCLHQLLLRTDPVAVPGRVTPRVWYLRRAQR
jgi:hypothetical protein